ncbi:MAG: cell division protein ZapA [Candidatus Marinimicrobia bacterium]|nr:cell division protein ZapA [Candidatus Neomarinimicrobiota bacterium]MCF7801747.1 cell division protein ZapA [Candidatus Neomarinimicrobiota bacterium]MCF7840375.1 cell division protein ZapA [Candidatus Neomarinimicrobiota bacterium]MCF7842682.1 cell division protein ZapA [Lentisphaeria bacterium]
MHSDSSNNQVQVTIFGKSYTVKGMADPSYITNVANYVDKKMHEVEENLPNVQSESRTAILAAMTVTDELFGLRRKHEKQLSQFEDRIQSLSDLIDESLST